MLVLWSLFVATVLLLIYWLPLFLRLKQHYTFSKTIPGPSMWEFVAAATSERGIGIDFFRECRQKYGPVFGFWLGWEYTMMFSDAEDIKTITTSNAIIDKSNNYSHFEVWLGKGLLTNGGEDWHLKRKLLTPGFHFQILSNFREPIEECCDILVNQLNEVADGRDVNIYKYIALLTLDVICETAMGTKVNAQLNEHSEFVRKTEEACVLMQTLVTSPWRRIPFLYQFTASKKELDATLKILHHETKRVIKERRSILEAQANAPENTFEEDDLGKKQRRPFLDSLLIAQKESGLLTDANIQEEVDTFMFEGRDATSSAIGFTVFLLASHPEVQQKVFEEISNCSDNLQSLPYLESVIKETLRLYPSFVFFTRQPKEPFTIGKYIVPPNVIIGIAVTSAQREAAHFPDPDVFRPERFARDAPPIHPYAHIAFSAGPRNCIGQKFAMLELKCAISRLLRAFEIRAVPGFEMQLKPELNLKSRNGIMVRLKKRIS